MALLNRSLPPPQDKFNIIKGKLERQEENNTSERDSSILRQTSDIDASVARLQIRGSTLETGQRCANKVGEVKKNLPAVNLHMSMDHQIAVIYLIG